MDKSLARKWVKALRSGKYSQTKQTLQDKSGYCCLGVLCEISGKDLERNEMGYLKGTLLDSQDLNNLLSGSSVGQYTYTTLNDNPGKIDEFGGIEPLTFDEIADVVQAVEILGVLDYENEVKNG